MISDLLGFSVIFGALLSTIFLPLCVLALVPIPRERAEMPNSRAESTLSYLVFPLEIALPLLARLLPGFLFIFAIFFTISIKINLSTYFLIKLM